MRAFKVLAFAGVCQAVSVHSSVHSSVQSESKSKSTQGITQSTMQDLRLAQTESAIEEAKNNPMADLYMRI